MIEKESVSHSVVSDSWRPHGLYPTSIHGILQARILERVAISFFRGSSQPRDRTQASYIGRQIPHYEPLGKPLITQKVKVKVALSCLTL